MTEAGRRVLIVKAYSDIGIKNIPNHMHERNDGVYFGSDAIVTDELRNALEGIGKVDVIDFRFTRNSDVTGENIFEIFARDTGNLADLIVSNSKESDEVIVVGGDNSVFLSAFIADAKRFASKRIGIIDFDTHGDIHLKETSPTGNIHGMYLRPIFDKFDVPSIDKLVEKKLKGEDIIYFGNFDFEKEESDFLDIQNIPRFTKQDIRLNNDVVLDTLKNFLSLHDHILINFDIDVFDSTLVSATGIPNSNGLIENDVFPKLNLLKQFQSKTLVISELNPEKEGRIMAERISQNIIMEIFG